MLEHCQLIENNVIDSKFVIKYDKYFHRKINNISKCLNNH